MCFLFLLAQSLYLDFHLMNTPTLQLRSRVGRKGDGVNRMSHFVLLKIELKSHVLKHQVQSHTTLKSHLYFYITQGLVQALWKKGKSGQIQGKQTHNAIGIFNSAHTIEKPAQQQLLKAKKTQLLRKISPNKTSCFNEPNSNKLS